MGRKKAMLPVEGVPLVERLRQALAPLGPVAVSVAGVAQLADWPGERWIDIRPGAGPLAGLHTALQRSQTETVFVVACDMPFVTAETAQTLLAALTPQAQAVVPRERGGQIHPLCAVYRRSALGIVECQLQRGDYRVRALAASLPCVYFPAEHLPGGARSLWNWNSPVETPPEFAEKSR